MHDHLTNAPHAPDALHRRTAPTGRRYHMEHDQQTAMTREARITLACVQWGKDPCSALDRLHADYFLDDEEKERSHDCNPR
jgi:hypothetical protein